MIPSIQCFARGLLFPQQSLRRLHEAQITLDEWGIPRLERTSHFVEVKIKWCDKPFLVYMPLNNKALFHVERTAAKLRQRPSPMISPYRLLHDEFRWVDDFGKPQSCDLLIQPLVGISFEEALMRESGTTLLRALDRLEEEFLRIGFAHRNLKCTNMRWDGEHFIPLRYHDARIATTEGLDHVAFEQLRQKIRTATGMNEGSMWVEDVALDYDTDQAPTEVQSALFEGLRSFKNEGLWGYCDQQGKVVIPARFCWAGDFHEGRAEVETHNGMALIDRKGQFVIEDRYPILDYDASKSITWAFDGTEWICFDYLGTRIKHSRNRPSR